MKRARVAYAGARARRRARTAGRRADGVRLADGRVLAEDEVVWLPPFEAGTIIALGLNYADHAKELALQGAGGAAGVPQGAGRAARPPRRDAPPGRRQRSCTTSASWRWSSAARAQSVAPRRRAAARRRLHASPTTTRSATTWRTGTGRTCASRTATAAPCSGPGWSTPPTSPDPRQLGLRTFVNGKLTQQGNTRDLIFDVPFLIEYLSALHDARARRRDPHRHARRRGRTSTSATRSSARSTASAGCVNTIVGDAAFGR